MVQNICFASKRSGKYLLQHYFFSAKTVFFKAQSTNRIFFSAENFVPSNLLTEKKIPLPLQVKWMFPYYHLTTMDLELITYRHTMELWD